MLVVVSPAESVGDTAVKHPHLYSPWVGHIGCRGRGAAPVLTGVRRLCSRGLATSSQTRCYRTWVPAAGLSLQVGF